MLLEIDPADFNQFIMKNLAMVTEFQERAAQKTQHQQFGHQLGQQQQQQFGQQQQFAHQQFAQQQHSGQQQYAHQHHFGQKHFGQQKQVGQQLIQPAAAAGNRGSSQHPTLTTIKPMQPSTTQLDSAVATSQHGPPQGSSTTNPDHSQINTPLTNTVSPALARGADDSFNMSIGTAMLFSWSSRCNNDTIF